MFSFHTYLKSVASLLIFSGIIAGCKNDETRAGGKEADSLSTSLQVTQLRLLKTAVNNARSSHIYNTDTIATYNESDSLSRAHHSGENKTVCLVSKDSLKRIICIMANRAPNDDMSVAVTHYFTNKGFDICD